MDYYLKSKWAAEAWQELALLKLKEEKFWYDGEVDYDPTNPRADASLILADDPNNTNAYHENKDVSLGYEIQSEAVSYAWSLEQGDFQVIPLFVKRDWLAPIKTEQPSVTITSGTGNNFAWNIIWERVTNGLKDPIGISGNNAFSHSDSVSVKSLVGWWLGYANESAFSVTETTIEQFLLDSDNNYLTIFNKGNTVIAYEVSTPTSNSDFFTKPVTTIISQAKIGEIKQNIQLEIDNDKYFDVLKYSLFDG